MRTLSEIYSEKRWVAANLKKAGLWCAIGLAITLVSLLLSSHVGFSVITLGAIGWGGWNVYKCMKRLDELKEEEKLVSEHKSSPSYTDTPRTVSTRTSSPVEKKVSPGLRSKTWS